MVARGFAGHLATVAVMLAGCGTAETSPAATPSASVAASPTTSASSSPPVKPQLSTANSRYGRIIVDGSGRTLYLFDAEGDRTPKCYDACAASWPPQLATTASTSDPRLIQSMIGVSARRDGSRQLSYNGHPLYYYVGDRSPGQILCQAVFEFGGGWYVIDPGGNKITAR
jgi:predicted lipoprotein with Yx(FWY)xxD motif